MELRVYDLGSDERPRYVVFYSRDEFLVMSNDMTFSAFGTLLEDETTEGLGSLVELKDLPPQGIRHVVARLSQGEPYILFQTVAELHEWRQSVLGLVV